MDTCSKCGQERSGDFSWCKSCRASYDKERYQQNREAHIAQRAERRRKNAEWTRQQKTGPCTDCDNRYPAEIMEFDHLPEYEKSYTIANMQSLSRKRIQEEIDKCELVCPTCHALRTLTRRDVGQR